MSGAGRLSHGELELSGRRLRYRLRCTPRRRHVHLLVGDDAVVEVRAPARYPQASAEAVIREHADWLEQALARAAAHRERRPPLVDGSLLPLLDEQLELRLRTGASGRPRVWRQACRLHVWTDDDSRAALEGLLGGWYRREARTRLGSRLEELARTVGVKPSGLAIRAQRTRWGSCSARGTISLNWRLVLMPAGLADYVLVHELCHLRHMDHSPAFWAAVAEAMPDYATRRKRLRERQALLPL